MNIFTQLCKAYYVQLKITYRSFTSIFLTNKDIYFICLQNISENLSIAAAENVNHHLKKLQKEKKVSGDTGAWLIRV